MTALIILFVTALAVLFAGLFGQRSALQTLTLVGLAGAFGVCMLHLNHSGDNLSDKHLPMLDFDQFALSFGALVILATFLIIGLSRFGFRQLTDTLGDNYALLLFSLCGALCMFAFNNMMMLFLGIEILSIPLYVLAGSRRDDLASNEAALKYFLMGAFATSILLFGMTLVYGATGTFDTAGIGRAVAGSASPGMLKAGILLIIVGMSFKVSAVPFHFWTPDVYQGSPNLVTAFMATVVKTAGFAAFYRLFTDCFMDLSAFWGIAIAGIAVMTMTLANFTAIFQTDFKRMMAYSSISHAGYLMLAILAAGVPGSDGAILLYMLTYSIATICAFATYILVAEPNMDGSFAAFNGLGKKEPWLAFVMAFSMLSLAGIPPLAGFFGKYFLFTSVVSEYPWLVVIAVINSAVSIYYYFKVIVAMYFAKEENPYTAAISTGARSIMIAGILLLLLLTVVPGMVYGLVGR